MTLQLTVLASGNGSNFQAIIDAIETGNLNAKIVQLITDNPQAHAIQRAQKHKIPFTILDRKQFSDKNSFENALLGKLKECKTDYVVLAGYMRIISPLILKAFPHKVLNIHPSLLPDFPGLHVIEKAFQAGRKKMGCTVHFVDEGCDTGPIIAQSSFDVQSQDTLESITERMHQHEHKLYVQVLNWLSEEKISLQNGKVVKR